MKKIIYYLRDSFVLQSLQKPRREEYHNQATPKSGTKDQLLCKIWMKLGSLTAFLTSVIMVEISKEHVWMRDNGTKMKGQFHYFEDVGGESFLMISGDIGEVLQISVNGKCHLTDSCHSFLLIRFETFVLSQLR